MIDPVTDTSQRCEDIALGAYVDGELDDRARAIVEEHLKTCSECRAGLRAHQYFLCELDSALSHDFKVPIPKNFSRVVTARATSDMAGLRSAGEHKKALFFCIVLALASFVLLGSSTRRLIFAAVDRIFSKIGLIDVVWNAFYDVVTSAVIISRVISRRFVIESGSFNLLLILLAFAIILLSLLIFNYHRTRAVD